MGPQLLYSALARFAELGERDLALVRTASDCLREVFPAVVDDFYNQILAEPETRRILESAPDVFDAASAVDRLPRLKAKLADWLRELFESPRDTAYCERRWNVGRVHVALGLRQTYVHAALSRMRSRLVAELYRRWSGPGDDTGPAVAALNKLLDLDLALIEDAYHTEFARKLQESERLAASSQIAHGVALIGRLALETPDVDTFLDAVCRHTAELLHFDVCGILEAAPDGAGLILKAGRGWPRHKPGEMVVTTERLSLPSDALRSGTLCAGNVQPSHAEQDVFGQGVVMSGLVAPVPGRLGVFGVLAGYQYRPRAFTTSEQNFLSALASMLGAAMGRMESEQRARQSERLAAIGQMAAGLAHESRNAVQRSQACLEMLALQVEDRPRVHELVERATRAQDHLLRLFEEVRTYAGPIRLNRQPCDIGLVWRETWDDLALQHRPKDLRLVEESECPDLLCHVDWHAMVQVFRNILDNAIDASPQGGPIRIACRPSRLAGGPALRLIFQDEGPGLNAEQRLRIFEPFYTTKTRGTGLGMAIARRIVEAHGGRLELGAPLAPGAEVILHLPR